MMDSGAVLWLSSFSPLAWLYRLCTEGAGAESLWRGQLPCAATAVLVALALDRLWGEPPAWLHPVVHMGRLLGVAGKYIAPSVDLKRDWNRFLLGMIVWCVLAAMVFAAYGAIQSLLPGEPWWLAGALMGVLLKPLLSWRMLKQEVLAVEAALQQSLAAGRERLSWLVSRDTAQLDAATVRESAIESMAENLNDSVIAPLFWFALAGLPGAAFYRLANTADAMWGYPGWRGEGDGRRHWQWAGKWAARADDVLNWIPARLTACWLALLAGGLPWRALRRDARATPSPNGGWPMGAMALALGVRLSKPGVYRLNPQGRAPTAADLQRAVRLAAQVIAAQVACALAALLALAAWGWRAHG